MSAFKKGVFVGSVSSWGWRRVVSGLSIALTLSAAWPAHAEGSYTDLTADEQARIDHGEIIVHVAPSKTPIKHFMVVGQVEASAEETYHVFTDYPHYAEIFHIRQTKILHQDGDTLDVKAILDAPWPIGERWVVNETTLVPNEYSFIYHRVEGSILEYRGSLKIVPMGPKLCQVYYTAKTDPGIPFLPVWLINKVQATMLPGSIKAVREYIKRHQQDQ